MAPVNIAGQPITLVRGLRELGVDISLVQYNSHKFGYDSDRVVQWDVRTRDTSQLETVETLLREGNDIFHFWLRSLYFSGVYDGLTGWDIPIIRSYGRKVVYRFTGEDLRVKSLHIKRNPHNAYQYGYSTKIDEEKQVRYLEFLRENVDQFVVQDPEMHQYWPEARVVPRAINLKKFEYVGVSNTARPLVCHAPSAPQVKGTEFVRKAVSELADEGLEFDYKEIQGLRQEEAIAVYRKSDIVIDQLHIGWYGVLAVEAMALGKAVICYVQPDLLQNRDIQPPLIPANPLNIKSVLRGVIKDADMRREIGPQARTYVEKIHDINVVAPQMLAIYQRLPTNYLVTKNTYGTLEYFKQQRASEQERELELRALRRKAGRYDDLAAEVKTLRFASNRWLAVKGELAKLRYGAQRWAEIKNDLPVLRGKALKYDNIIAEGKRTVVLPPPASFVDRIRLFRSIARLPLSTGNLVGAGSQAEFVALRNKARRVEELSEEVKSLRFAAKQWETAKHELMKLRYAARKWEETKQELMQLRAKVGKSGDVVVPTDGAQELRLHRPKSGRFSISRWWRKGRRQH